MRRSMQVAMPTVLAAVMLLGCQSGAGGETGEQATGRDPSTASTASSVSAEPSSPANGSASGSASGSATGSPSASARGRVGLFFGDSNFVGGGCTPDPSQDMAQIAADRLGYTAVIRGEGGTGFATGNPQYDLPGYLGQIRQGALRVSPAPQLIVVEGGSNDTGSPLGRITRNAEKVLQIAHATYPDARLVLMGPIDVRAGLGDVRPRIVGALQYAAGQEGVPFLDAYAWLPWRTQSGLLCSDYDHATLAGQRILGRTLATQLRALGA